MNALKGSGCNICLLEVHIFCGCEHHRIALVVIKYHYPFLNLFNYERGNFDAVYARLNLDFGDKPTFVGMAKLLPSQKAKFYQFTPNNAFQICLSKHPPNMEKH